MPDQVASNLQAISGFQIQLKEISSSISHGRERRLMLERQLADVESLPTSSPLPNVAADPAQRQSAAQQLEMAKAQLEAMKQRYKPEHPDIKAGERLIRDLQLKADEEAKQAKLNPTKALAGGTGPAAQHSRSEGSDRGHRPSDFGRQCRGCGPCAPGSTSISRALTSCPTSESELVELTRDYETLQADLHVAAGQARRFEARGQSRARSDRRAVPNPRPRVAAASARTTK